MATSTAATPDEYIARLPEERRAAVSAVREVIRRNLPAGYEEGLQYGTIGWYVPLAPFPDTYNGRPLALAGLASQKRYISLYLSSVYGDRATEVWFRGRYAATGKKLDMGKSCLRFTQAQDIPLDLIGETIARADLDSFIAHHRDARGSSRKTRRQA